MRYILICFLLAGIYSISYAQDTVRRAAVNNSREQKGVSILDSVALATVSRQQFVSDSLSMVFVKRQDPSRRSEYIERMMKEYVYQGYGFLDIVSPKKNFSSGAMRKTRDSWVIGVVIFLLLYTAFLRLTITRDINNMVQAFYNKQLFSQGDNDGSLLSMRAFLSLMILLGLTFGLLVYQLSTWYKFDLRADGFVLFSAISAGVILLVVLKLLLLKLLGFVFNVSQLADKYIAILCFTYFTITFVFLPVVACLSLITAQLISAVIFIAVVLTGIILIWLYLRNSVIVISNFRFSKFYLFVYLCALEICPIFILIKALNI